MATESYRISFNMDNDQHIREFLMLKDMDTRTRSQFIHLAIGLLGRKIGYQMPKDGMMGVYASLSGNPAPSMNIELPEIDKSVLNEKKTTKRQHKEKIVDTTTINPTKEMPEEQDSASAFIMGTLTQFDDDL